jgi:hypothetical protein
MPNLQSLYSLLGTLAMTSPKLVLMRGRDYYRIEDLWRWARQDWAGKNSKVLRREALSEAIYWTEVDPHGKLLLKGMAPKGDEFVAYVEPGSEIQTDIV